MSVKRPNRLRRVSLLTNSFTTFSRFRMWKFSLWKFRSARELNLAGNIVDHSHVFRLLANKNVLSAVALVAGLTTTSLMILITLEIKITSSVVQFCICCLTSSKHIKFSFWHFHQLLTSEVQQLSGQGQDHLYIYTFHIFDLVCNAFVR